jgi:hypothetical protein
MNIIGFFVYTTIIVNNVNILDKDKRQISEQQFWGEAYKKVNENIESYVHRLTSLVSSRILFIDPKYTKPTIFENWILFIYSRWLGEYEWTETKRAVRLGGGWCSQHAIILNNILRSQHIESRIISLSSGHVLNEVLIEGKWRVYDSMFNVDFNSSLKYLESNPERAFQAYMHAGLSEDEARYYQQFFGIDADIWHYRSSMHFRPYKNMVELGALYLVWIVPIMLIFSGISLRKWKCIRLHG